MKKERPIIVGVGELLWDMLPSGKRAGGAPVNFVYHATQMGAEGYAISAIGNDANGREIEKELLDNNIGNLLAHVDYPTGIVEVELKDGIPSYNIVENVAWDHIPLQKESLDLMSKADAVCFGTLSLRSPESRNTILSLLDATPKDSLRLFDVNIRQNYYSKELIVELLKKSNVFKINDEELVLLRTMMELPENEEEAARQIMREYDLKYLILTAGSKYSSVFSETDTSTIITPKVEVVDTVGAGDSFSGSFIYSILTGKSLKEAHESAVKTAAFVCTQEGAWPKYHNSKKPIN